MPRREKDDVVHCPECGTPFEARDGVVYQQDGFPRVLYCRADCLLDARERRVGRDPRRRWPRLMTRIWRGKDVR